MLEWIFIVSILAVVVGAVGALFNWQARTLRPLSRNELPQDRLPPDSRRLSPDDTGAVPLEEPAEKSPRQQQLEKHNGYGSFVFLGGILTLFIGASSAAGNPGLGGTIAMIGLALAVGGYVFMKMTKKPIARVKKMAPDSGAPDATKEESRSL